MKNRLAVLIGTVAALTGGAAVLSAAAFLAFVTPLTMSQSGWSARESGKASMRFVDSAAVPVLLADAVEFSVKKGEGEASLRLTELLWEMKLERLGGISYNTFLTKGCESDKHSKKNDDEKHAEKKHRPAIRVVLSIDTDGDHVADDELAFNPAANGDVACGAWQIWNTGGGVWRTPSKKHGLTIDQYLALHPNAIITFGGVQLVAGGDEKSDKDLVGYVGQFTISRIDPCDPEVPFCLPGPAGTYIFQPD